ncbi:MAG: tetratricopeptide repeat protein [Chlorobium sp.]|nr:MAG: tetratricopeptide repeat protein [Chlorobium sp.]
MKDFFVSYTGADLQIASWIAWVLEDAGYSVVFQEWDFRAAGPSVIGNIDSVSKECERTLLVLSPDYFDSAFTKLEWETVVHKDPSGELGLLVPVVVKECTIDGVLRRLVSVSLLGLEEQAAKSTLLAALKRDRTKSAVKPLYKNANQQHSLHKPRYPGTLPEICNLPRRNPNFTGRESILETLRTSLQSGQNTAITQQAIHGLGGIGKTQLAIEYAWRHIADYDLIWWIRAEESSTLANDYASLAVKLNLPEKEVQDQKIVIEAVREWLDHNQNWLLIFDNARDSDSILHYLPNATAGHALITSRNQNWSNNLCNSLKIEVWSREESLAFLQKRITGIDELDAAKLSETLGYLPLSLEQAAAYGNARHKSCAEYLDLFSICRQELWNREKHPDNYPDTVATTWTLAFQETDRVPYATEILNLCSLVAPDAIPQSLILKALEYHAGQASEPPIDTLRIDDALEALTTYSLITYEQNQFSIHRLVQTVAQDRMQAEERDQYCHAAIQALSELFPDEGFTTPDCWPECSALTSHAEALFESVADDTAVWQEFSLLLTKMGSYFHGHADYGKAEPLLHRSLEIREKVLGTDHPAVALSLNNLASLLDSQGKYAEAEPLYRRAVAIHENAPGTDHPNTIIIKNNLDDLLCELGDDPHFAQKLPFAFSIIVVSSPRLSLPQRQNLYAELELGVPGKNLELMRHWYRLLPVTSYWPAKERLSGSAALRIFRALLWSRCSKFVEKTLSREKPFS